MSLPSARTVGVSGLVVMGTILVLRIDPSEAKEVLIHAIDACKEIAIAYRAAA